MYGEGNQETPWKDSFPICYVYREYSGRNAALTERKAKNPCIQVPDFPPRFPGAQGRRNEFCRFVKSFTTNQKHGLPSFAA